MLVRRLVRLRVRRETGPAIRDASGTARARDDRVCCATCRRRSAAIHIFPLKSCAPLPLASAHVGTRGFDHDRRWMVIDADDAFVTGRDEPRLTLIRALPDDGALTLNAPGMPELRVATPTADAARVATAVWGAAVTPRSAGADADAWISTFLGRACRLVHMDADCHRAVKAKYDGRYGQ